MYGSNAATQSNCGDVDDDDEDDSDYDDDDDYGDDDDEGHDDHDGDNICHPQQRMFLLTAAKPVAGGWHASWTQLTLSKRIADVAGVGIVVIIGTGLTTRRLCASTTYEHCILGGGEEHSVLFRGRGAG